ncbi:MAG: helix-turn-helix domain-containing protein [Calothrix sp. SM1_7_51]|nr:helix-turn-helix domain-containing protein [Calothrix sp. SM1_7_51]
MSVKNIQKYEKTKNEEYTFRYTRIVCQILNCQPGELFELNKLAK